MSLSERYKNAFRIGTAVDYENCPKYNNILTNHFNSISPENDMKFEIIHPYKDKYEWERLDKLVNYAKHKNFLVRGHTLIWHEQIPEWVKKFAGNPSQLKGILCNHISMIVDRYKDDVYCWDVVNEVISDENDMLRKTLWSDTLGLNFIDYAFSVARDAAPNSLLFLNEYNGHVPEKREKIMHLVKEMRRHGTPIDGIGIQGHYNIYYPSIDMIRNELEDYIKLGLKIQITELDISLFDFFDRRTDLLSPTDEMVKKQEEMYFELFSLFEEYKEFISVVTLWGVADDHTWLDTYPISDRKDWPLLFDENLNIKPVLRRLVGERR